MNGDIMFRGWRTLVRGPEEWDLTLSQHSSIQPNLALYNLAQLCVTIVTRQCCVGTILVP